MIIVTDRKLNIPRDEQIVGFTGDNLVETRVFELSRTYGDIDLSLFDFKLDTQVGKVKNIIDLAKVVAEETITLTWTIEESHVLYPGYMAIQLRAFHGEVEKWHSAQEYVMVLPSINATEAQPDPLPSEFVQMEQKVTATKNQAQAAAETAEQQADRAQGIADTFENTTLPAAIQSVEQAVEEQIGIAKGHADRAQELADTFEQTTLPAAISAVEAAGQAKVDLAEQQAERVEDIIREAEQDVLPELRQAIEDGIETKDQLGGSIQEAGEAKTALDGSISSAGTAKGELDGSITEANTAKGQLDDSIDLAGNAKTELGGSITTAEQTKQALDESIATGDLDSFKADYMQFKNDSTLETAKIEKELNDYKATLAGMNPNQEPKQKVNGYGIVSLPKNAANGQVSAILKGNTWTNRAGIGDTSPQTIENLDSAKTYLLIKTDGGTVNVDAVDTAVPAKITGKTSTVLTWASGKIALYELSTAEAALTEAQLGARYHYVSGTKSTVSAMRLKSVSADETETSTAYVVTKDEEGKIAELRSLPNGTKDEVSVSEEKVTQNVSDECVLQAEDITSVSITHTNVSVATTAIPYKSDIKPAPDYYTNTLSVLIDSWTQIPLSARDRLESIGKFYLNTNGQIGFVVAKGTTLEQARTQLAGTKLTYQLAVPVKKPVQVSGTLVSYPSGTVYIEPYVADAGIYTDKMKVLYSDLPIKALEKISKVDFDTGLETELDITAAVIAEDKLSFTHPDLTSGDIVFFVYEHGAEGTIPETEISYYDSRYVIKGEDDKFYQWEIEAKLVEGVITPSIKLVEV